MYKFITFATIISCFYYNVYGWSDCGSKLGTIDSITISNCDSDERCVLKRGTNVSIDLTFTPNDSSDAVKVDVHGIILGVPLPFEMPNTDGCKDSGLECPIKAGQHYTYKSTFPILTQYPKVTVDVKWELQNNAGEDLICALIPAKIK